MSETLRELREANERLARLGRAMERERDDLAKSALKLRENELTAMERAFAAERLSAELLAALKGMNEQVCGHFRFAPWEDRSTCSDRRDCKDRGCSIARAAIAKAEGATP